MKKLYILVLCIALCIPSTLLSAQPSCSELTSPNSDSMLVDLVFIRPLGIVGTAAGTIAYVVSLPFTLLGGNAGEAGQTLVVEPAAYTFARPLGSKQRCK